MGTQRTGSGISTQFQRRLLITLLAVTPLLMLAVLAVDAAGVGVIYRISTESDGSQAAYSELRPTTPSLTPEGHYVTFDSGSSTLVAWDTNGKRDVFIKNTVSGAVRSVSITGGGAQANDSSFASSVSADGRYVAFQSYADNLVPGDDVQCYPTNSTPYNCSDIFVKDLMTGNLIAASTDSSGVMGNKDSYLPAISADGRFVAFTSAADNLVPNDTQSCTYFNLYGYNCRDIFVKDLLTGDISMVSTNSAGVPSNGESYALVPPAISADGRFIAFASNAANLVNGNSAKWQVFVKDMHTGAVAAASTDANGVLGNDWSGYAGMPRGGLGGISISADGRYVAFGSIANNLSSDHPDKFPCHIYLKDMWTGSVMQIASDDTGNPSDGDSGSPSLSADGRFIAFESRASNLVPGAPSQCEQDYYGTSEWFGFTRNCRQVYLKDTFTGDISLLSSNEYGNPGTADSVQAATSDDGRSVAFTSAADNLLPSDTDIAFDTFLAATSISPTSGRPQLDLSLLGVSWRSYSDYINGILAVDYRVTNNSSTTAYNVSITGSSAGGGVTCVEPMPLGLGNLTGGMSHGLTINYFVPDWIQNFLAQVHAEALDGSGEAYIY